MGSKNRVASVIAILVLAAWGGMFRLSFENIQPFQVFHSLLLSSWLKTFSPSTAAMATGVVDILVVNLTGSFALGFLAEVLGGRRVPEWLRDGVATGLIGSFTTFSSFATTVVHLAATSFLSAALYVVLSISGGAILCFAGEKMARRLRTEKSQEQRNGNQQYSGQKRGTRVPSARYPADTEPDR
ncbi:CrcB family protein [Alicyclobacillus tolerans]|uniref:fluoride efflux transporter FluC n=1 Tax=Alicyclobacillus tolerans TaxID=90970 RepID=UPI001F4731A7|nr:CrcB family protein [Alicyclobacillus tolerans]MCF8564886.1 CrcB family protein [Alicyclobacillus tolerans]